MWVPSYGRGEKPSRLAWVPRAGLWGPWHRFVVTCEVLGGLVKIGAPLTRNPTLGGSGESGSIFLSAPDASGRSKRLFACFYGLLGALGSPNGAYWYRKVCSGRHKRPPRWLRTHGAGGVCGSSCTDPAIILYIKEYREIWACLFWCPAGVLLETVRIEDPPGTPTNSSR